MMNLKTYLNEYVSLIMNDEITKKLEYFGQRLQTHRNQDGRLLIFGNGASASTASHAALDFTKQGKIEANCFHDPALLTAFSNDYGFENAFKEILNAYYRSNDIVIFISVSGESPNIISALDRAKELGLYSVGFSGRDQDNTVAKQSDLSFWVNSHAYNIVENLHSIWITSMIDYLVGHATYEVK